MKILFVCDTLGSGGAERVITTLSNEFSQREHTIFIVMLSKLSTEPFYDLNKNINLIYLDKDSKHKTSFFKKSRILKKCILGIQPDIVISFLSYVCIYTWWALRKTNIPYIVSERNDPNNRSALKQKLLSKSFQKASGCVFQTHDAMNWYGNKVANKSVVIFNPVTISPCLDVTKKRKKQILYVGRFTKQKNCLMLVDSFNVFQKKHPEYVLKMYGSGSLTNEIEQRIHSYDLTNKVFIFPSSKTWQSDECDSAVFVLPSLFEGMPNVLAEALCLGIPSVSTDCTIGGPKELKKIFNDRLVLSKGIDYISFADAIEKALLIKEDYHFEIPLVLDVKTIVDEWIDFIHKVRG